MPAFLVSIALALPACTAAVPDGGGYAGGITGGDPSADLAQWNQESSSFDARRSMFLGPNVQELAAVGNQVFWYDTTNFDFRLARYDDTTQQKLAYGFSVGSGDTDNYRASSSLVVTADASSDPVVYHAYDAGKANAEVASITRMKPSGAQWDAYAVSGSTAYLVDTSTPGSTTLLKWTPGQGDPVPVTTLESAGADVGEFQDFDVSGNTMVFVESGRIWKLDLAANQATWLMNQTEVDGAVDFRSDGVMFSSATGIMFFDYQKGSLLDVTAAINANPFQINATYASASNVAQSDFSRWKNQVLYIGEGGLFAYDMAGDAITPILLSPISDSLRVDYRYPVALDDGTAFVTGLTSTDGATGADGPTYKLNLSTVLP
jgi:hypothetical protein